MRFTLAINFLKEVRKMAKHAKKSKRKMQKTNGEWSLSGRTNRHHNFARVRGGTWAKENIFIWDINIHRAFHFIFGNRTLLEAAEWLIYIDSMKRQDVEVDIQGGESCKLVSE
jgi:hypothetical protein